MFVFNSVATVELEYIVKYRLIKVSYNIVCDMETISI